MSEGGGGAELQPGLKFLGKGRWGKPFRANYKWLGSGHGNAELFNFQAFSQAMATSLYVRQGHTGAGFHLCWALAAGQWW